eukprot:s2809_g4.t1
MVEDQTEGVEAQPGTPKLREDERDRSRSPPHQSAPSGSAPASASATPAAVPPTAIPAAVPPTKTPPKRKAATAADGVTGAALAEAKSTLAKAKENDEALRKATEQRLKEAAEALPGRPEMEDDEEQPVILPRALLHRLGDLARALQQQGLLNEKYMAQSQGDLEKCAEALADLCQSVKVPRDMFAHVASLADGVSYYAGEVKRMLSINKEDKTRYNGDWLQDGKAKKPMSAYVRELTNSTASTSAATLGIQADMSESKAILKQLLETMERAAIAAEKTSTILLQQGWSNGFCADWSSTTGTF